MNSQLARRRAIIFVSLSAILTASVWVGLNLPANQICIQHVQRGGLTSGRPAGLPPSVDTLRRSGWPWNRRVELIPNAAPDRPMLLYASARNAVGNGLVGLLMIGSVTAYTWRRDRKIASSPNPNGVRFRYDVCSALVCLMIPAGVYLGSNRTARRDLILAHQLAPHGRCLLVAELPEWLAPRIPAALHHAFLRITAVDLYRPPADLLDESLLVPTLRRIQLGDLKLEPDDLTKIKNLRELTDIGLLGCPLDSSIVAALADHARLRTLTLGYCSLGPPDLEQLNRLRQLERVDFSLARLRLSNFKQNAWAGSVRSLRLPSPTLQGDDRLEIHDWLRLEEVGMQADFNRDDDSTIELHLVTCPSLKSLFLSTSQRYSINGTVLPALVDIREPIESLEMRGSDFNFSDLPRWRDVRLNGASHLRQLMLDADHLNTLNLEETNRMREIGIGRSLFTPIHVPMHEATDYPNSREWMQQIGGLSDVRSIVLDNIRLDTDHLGLIAHLRSLRRLTVTNADLTDAMLDPLVDLRSLTELDLHSCPIGRTRLNQFLEFPNLKNLTADLSALERFHMSNRPRIRGITTLPFRRLKSLRLRNLPAYSGAVVVQEGIDQLSVVNVPHLSELAIECPWPSDSRLANVPDLLRFAGGGPELNDPVLASLSECRNLDQLIVAYPSLSRMAMKRIGEMRSLTALEIPGCDVDDEVVMNWQDLKRLRRVCFDDTRISEQTCRWLLSLQSLRSVSLKRLDLSEQSSAFVAALPQLSEICLADTPMPPTHVLRLIANAGLEIMDLSGHEITEEIVDAIADSVSLETLTLTGCQLPAESLEKMLQRNLQLLVIHDAAPEVLESLTESLQERIFANLHAFTRRHPFPQNRRSQLLTRTYDESTATERLVFRPFDTDRFRTAASGE